ncbi:hypothetical protein C3L33_12446, partial [Rhododendron williamsianum]
MVAVNGILGGSSSASMAFKSYSFLKLSKVNSRVVPHPIARGLDHALYYMTFVATEDMVGFLRISNLLCYPSWLMEKKSNFVGLKHQICLTEAVGKKSTDDVLGVNFARQNEGACQRVVCHAEVGVEVGGLEGAGCRIVVDGAWYKESWEGAIAWLLLGTDDVSSRSSKLKVYACSSFMVEAVAVLKALEWAKDRGWRQVEVLTDCLQLGFLLGVGAGPSSSSPTLIS